MAMVSRAGTCDLARAVKRDIRMLVSAMIVRGDRHGRLRPQTGRRPCDRGYREERGDNPDRHVAGVYVHMRSYGPKIHQGASATSLIPTNSRSHDHRATDGPDEILSMAFGGARDLHASPGDPNGLLAVPEAGGMSRILACGHMSRCIVDTSRGGFDPEA
jgi:hypothetical protein